MTYLLTVLLLVDCVDFNFKTVMVQIQILKASFYKSLNFKAKRLG
jgi:hypothetical protein